MIEGVLIFLSGILSFFSPCILPLLPLYLSYLAGNSKDENIKKRSILFNTFLFSLGIATAFLVLGISFTALGRFLNENKVIFAKISGIIIILLALFHLGIINFNFLQREKRVEIELKKMSPFVAYIMGFTFSFAWTPCVGPMLSSILIMASNVGRKESLVMIGIYSLGFIIPFMLLGFFSTYALKFIQKSKKMLKYTVKISGIILLVLGVLTFSGYFTKDLFSEKNSNIMELKLKDQFGKEHSLEKYRDKIIFLNFWASWCPPCKEELAEIQKSYEKFGRNRKDIIFLGVVNPKNDLKNTIDDKTEKELEEFILKRKLTYPTIFDLSGEFVGNFEINVLPTTYIIKNFQVLDVIQGAVNEQQIEYIIEKNKEKTLP